MTAAPVLDHATNVQMEKINKYILGRSLINMRDLITTVRMYD